MKISYTVEEKQQSLSRKLQIGHFDVVRYQVSRGEMFLGSIARWHSSTVLVTIAFRSKFNETSGADLKHEPSTLAVFPRRSRRVYGDR